MELNQIQIQSLIHNLDKRCDGKKKEMLQIITRTQLESTPEFINLREIYDTVTNQGGGHDNIRAKFQEYLAKILPKLDEFEYEQLFPDDIVTKEEFVFKIFRKIWMVKYGEEPPIHDEDRTLLCDNAECKYELDSKERLEKIQYAHNKTRSIQTILEMICDRHYMVGDLEQKWVDPRHEPIGNSVRLNSVVDGINGKNIGEESDISGELTVQVGDIIYSIKYLTPIRTDTSVDQTTARQKNLKRELKIIKARKIRSSYKHIFITEIGNCLQPEFLNIEAIEPDVQVYHLTNLLHNISKNKLVPRHTILTTGEVDALKIEYKLTNLLDLPHILITDQMAKYLDLNYLSKYTQDTEKRVVKITRSGKSGIDNISYRVCVQDPDNAFNTTVTQSNDFPGQLDKAVGNSGGESKRA